MAAKRLPNDVLNQISTRGAGLGDPSIDAILRRAMLLPPAERQLLQLVLTGRHSLRELAAVTGLHPGSLCRRIQAIKARLHDPVAAALAEWGQLLSERQREIAIQRFVQGRPNRLICREFGLGRLELAELLSFIRAWALWSGKRVGGRA